MTSSLVGSEMCIRDRPKPGVSRKRLSAGTVWWRRCYHQNKRSAAATSPTVSYTHLTLPTICSV
eukprot:1482189-Prorocentrum_lima.AAC.1